MGRKYNQLYPKGSGHIPGTLHKLVLHAEHCYRSPAKSLWFGLLERLDDSLELFEYQTGLKIQMKHLNRNDKFKHLVAKQKRSTSKNQYPNPTEENIRKLKNLMPMDLFLYEYAKQTI